MIRDLVSDTLQLPWRDRALENGTKHSEIPGYWYEGEERKWEFIFTARGGREAVI